MIYFSFIYTILNFLQQSLIISYVKILEILLNFYLFIINFDAAVNGFEYFLIVVNIWNNK